MAFEKRSHEDVTKGMNGRVIRVVIEVEQLEALLDDTLEVVVPRATELDILTVQPRVEVPPACKNRQRENVM